MKKIRWSRVYESAEEELINFLHARNLQATRLHIESAEQQDISALTIWCAEGSLTVNGRPLQPGDAVSFDQKQTITINAGISGCVCYLTD